MFNTPSGTSPQMDIAKMLAKNELIEELQDNDFNTYREVCAGIAHFPSDLQIAKGQLAASALISLSLSPHILHVVAYCEGDHTVYPEELIESCNIVHEVIQNTLNGLPDFINNKKIVKRKNQLVKESRVLLEVLKNFGQSYSGDPLTNSQTLASAIKIGVFDTPHFMGDPHLCGKIKTNLINGAWYAIDEKSGKFLTEKDRLKNIN